MGIGKAMAVPTLAVTNLDQGRNFYGKILGFKEVELPSDEEGALFTVGNDSYVFVYERPTPSGSTATSCAFEVEDVEGTVAKLRSQGVKFEDYDIPEMGIKTVKGIASMNGFKTAWFKDPSGNILAIENSMMAYVQRGSGAYEGAHP